MVPMLATRFDSFGSTALDRFGGASAWDLFSEWRDAFYAELTAGKTCLDCWHCIPCDKTGHEGIGFCDEAWEFVNDADIVAENGCESFVGR